MRGPLRKHCQRCHSLFEAACKRCGEPEPQPEVVRRALFVRKDGAAIVGPDPDRDEWQIPCFPPEARELSFSRDDFKAPTISVLTFHRVSARPPVFVEVG